MIQRVINERLFDSNKVTRLFDLGGEDGLYETPSGRLYLVEGSRKPGEYGYRAFVVTEVNKKQAITWLKKFIGTKPFAMQLLQVKFGVTFEEA